MSYPRWLAKVNKRLFNPREVRRGKRPIVVHTGRSSGTIYYTPTDAHPTKSGYVLVARYGPKSDWIRNILAAGEATLRLDGEGYRLVRPRLVDQGRAIAELPDGYDPGKDFYKAEDYLLLDRGQA
jgi:deazaflavin-dependent oxidoreductase (nitroreductase family)